MKRFRKQGLLLLRRNFSTFNTHPVNFALITTTYFLFHSCSQLLIVDHKPNCTIIIKSQISQAPSCFRDIHVLSQHQTACAQKLIVKTVEKQHGRDVACTSDVLSMESMNRIAAKTGEKGSTSPVKKKLIRLLPPLPVRKSNFVVMMFGETRMCKSLFNKQDFIIII